MSCFGNVPMHACTHSLCVSAHACVTLARTRAGTLISGRDQCQWRSRADPDAASARSDLIAGFRVGEDMVTAL